MKSLSIVLCLLYFGSLAAQLNSTLGEVGGEIVSTRDVELHYIISHSLYHYKLEPQAVPLKADALSKAISNYMLESMVYKEAKTFELGKVTKREVQRTSTKALARILKSNFSKYWKSWQVETEELDFFVERNLRARKLITIKRKSAEVLVTDGEVDVYLKANSIKSEDRDRKKHRQTVKAFLGRKQGEQRIREWFQVLKSKYKVKAF